MGVVRGPNGLAHSAASYRKLPSEDDTSEGQKVVLCSEDALLRDCLERALRDADYEVQTVATVAEWLKGHKDRDEEPLFLFCIGARPTTDPSLREDIETILAQKPQPRLVIEGELDDPAGVIETMNAGAKGYFSPDTPLSIALLALEMVQAGGVYLPPTLLSADVEKDKPAPIPNTDIPDKLLTSRQKAVVAALRQGKSNKIIAYELNMRESTVKVHVRNIMKKLHARNRTEVAFLTQKLFQADDALTQRRK